MFGTVQGTLKGHDQLMNLVLDDVQEMLKGIVVQALTSFPSSSKLPFHCALHLPTSRRLQMTKATHPPAPLAS